jgi:uncharacterized membrane protein
VSTGRLEAFSDGVFAIAITLLVLEIHVPKVAGDHALGHALLEQWPTYASYVVSFLIIGIIWTNHHAVFDRIASVDRIVLFLNLLLLLWVALIPWPTALLAEYLREGGDDARVAALVYTGTMTAMGTTFGGLWIYLSRHPRLLGSAMTPEEIRTRTRRFVAGAPFYGVALLLAFVSAPAALALNFLLAVFYILPRGGSML